MATVTLKGNAINLSGNLVAPGADAPDATLIGKDLAEVKLSGYKGKVVILSAVPSLDTAVCDTETRRFNQEAANLGDDIAIVTVSRDLPFAQSRWCGAAGVDKVVTLSDFRDRAFGKAYGIEITSGPIAGLLARAVVVVNRDGDVTYSELVPEIAQEPDYDAALAAAKAAL